MLTFATSLWQGRMHRWAYPSSSLPWGGKSEREDCIYVCVNGVCGCWRWNAFTKRALSNELWQRGGKGYHRRPSQKSMCVCAGGCVRQTHTSAHIQAHARAQTQVSGGGGVSSPHLLFCVFVWLLLEWLTDRSILTPTPTTLLWERRGGGGGERVLSPRNCSMKRVGGRGKGWSYATVCVCMWVCTVRLLREEVGGGEDHHTSHRVSVMVEGCVRITHSNCSFLPPSSSHTHASGVMTMLTHRFQHSTVDVCVGGRECNRCPHTQHSIRERLSMWSV